MTKPWPTHHATDPDFDTLMLGTVENAAPRLTPRRDGQLRDALRRAGYPAVLYTLLGGATLAVAGRPYAAWQFVRWYGGVVEEVTIWTTPRGRVCGTHGRLLSQKDLR